MILEGIITSLDDRDTVNVAPMGPLVTPELTTLTLRPFQTSRTYANLKQRPYGVFHVIDDVLLLARAALNRLDVEPETHPAERIIGRVLEDCCRWFEFEITSCNDSDPRTRMEAQVVHAGHKRDFFGWNRAKHAVLEATILATRLHLLPTADVQQELRRLEPLVQKTAGPTEFAAWALVLDHIDEWTKSAKAEQ